MTFSVPIPIKSEVDLTVLPAHKFFEDLAAAMGATGGFISGLSRQRLSVNYMRQTCYVENVEVECYPIEVLNSLAKFNWPASLTLKIVPVAPPSSISKTSSPDGTQRLMGSLYAHAFLTYYENVKDLIQAKEGKKEPWAWSSEVLKMAFIVRNAFGHGGKIKLRDTRLTANWRNLALSKANDGEQLLYNHMTSGDLTLLVLDVEDLI